MPIYVLLNARRKKCTNRIVRTPTCATHAGIDVLTQIGVKTMTDQVDLLVAEIARLRVTEVKDGGTPDDYSDDALRGERGNAFASTLAANLHLTPREAVIAAKAFIAGRKLGSQA